MKTYYVTLAVNGSYECNVEAEDEQEAIQNAMNEINWGDIKDDNVYDVSVELIDGDDEEDEEK